MPILVPLQGRHADARSLDIPERQGLIAVDGLQGGANYELHTSSAG